jgi:hypothetical protein
MEVLEFVLTLARRGVPDRTEDGIASAEVVSARMRLAVFSTNWPMKVGVPYQDITPNLRSAEGPNHADQRRWSKRDWAQETEETTSTSRVISREKLHEAEAFGVDVRCICGWYRCA